MINNWKEIRLVDLALFRRGSFPQPYGLDKWYDDNNGMPFIQVYDVDDNMKLKRVTKRKISKLGAQMSVFIPKGSLILTIQGSIGRVAITDYEAYMDRTLLVFQKFYEEVDLKFIMYIIRELFNVAKENANGSTIKTITKEELSDYTIKLPPLPQQKKIAKILSTVDNVIEKTESAIAKYQAIKQGLMHDLFTRGIDVNTGKLRPTPQDAPAMYKESALGLIPKEWEVEELGKENETYAGGTPNRAIEDFYKGDIPWVASGEVNKSFIYKTKESITTDALRFSSAKMAPKESVLIAMYGATAAQVSMLKIEACTNQAVLAIIPNSLWNNYFIYYGLNYSKDRILFLAQGSGQPNLNKGMIDSTQFWKPKLDEQKIIVDRLNGIESKIQTEQQALAKYQQLKAGLLQDLLTGKVAVSVD